MLETVILQYVQCTIPRAEFSLCFYRVLEVSWGAPDTTGSETVAGFGGPLEGFGDGLSLVGMWKGKGTCRVFIVFFQCSQHAVAVKAMHRVMLGTS